jgi:FkbM family methyltransferase
MKQLVQKFLGKFGYSLRRTSALKTFAPFIRDFNFPEASFRMWIANADAKTWYEQEQWAKFGEFRALRKLVKKGDQVLEIGSHHGFTAMLLSKFVGPEGRVLSVEAHPQNAMIDHAQLGLNRSFSNLKFIHAACSDVPGTVKIFPSHNSNVVNENSNAANQETTDLIEVPAVTGDMLDKEHGPFDVVKIDVEGYEMEVLKGCKNLLSRAPKLALEIHMDWLGWRGQSMADIFKLIDVKRYDGEMILRHEHVNTDTVQAFDPSAIPKNGQANVFLERKRG